MNYNTYAAVFRWIFKWHRTCAVELAFVSAHFLCRKITWVVTEGSEKRMSNDCTVGIMKGTTKSNFTFWWIVTSTSAHSFQEKKNSRNSCYLGNPEGKLRNKICKVKHIMLIRGSHHCSVCFSIARCIYTVCIVVSNS